MDCWMNGLKSLLQFLFLVVDWNIHLLLYMYTVYHFFWLNVVMNIPYLEHMGICVNQTDMETPAVHLCHSPCMATLVVCQMSEISHDLTFIVISSIGAPRA